MSRKLSHKQELTLAFFVGAATTNIAFDVVDYVFYQASSGNIPLTPEQQAWVFAWFGTIYYAGFFVLGYLGFKFFNLSSMFPFYVYLFTVAVALYLTFGLPQSQSPFFVWTALLGSAVTVGIVYGFRKHTS